MPLTITVTLEDDDVEHFLALFNHDARGNITADILNQNSEFQQAVAADMITFWFDALEDQDRLSGYDLYNEFLKVDEVITLTGDPVFDRTEDTVVAV